MRYGLTIATAPSQEPVTVDQVKEQTRVDIGDEEGLLRRYIRTATRYAEQCYDRTTVTTVWRMTLDGFPCGNEPIKPPRPPLQSVTSITYTNSTGGTTTLASSDYSVDAFSEPGRITPVFGGTWPATRDVPNAVTVLYQAGYGGSTANVNESVAAVPETIKHGISLLSAHWFRNREPVLTEGSQASPLPYAVEEMLGAEWPGGYS